ncbi:39S ribosomal protein L23, mitochondrial isoform X3 [Hyaena hyaena]|uniref:39S ribosomal protein L23, mitochondrial isoform X3 n=1 Tax=Hyaena hyaena TaxID=95912 RepID=UPI00192082E0|nr:39S ribosomal protein L23, mitochondrial isoform X3 [Hyaena hyaena]
MCYSPGCCLTLGLPKALQRPGSCHPAQYRIGLDKPPFTVQFVPQDQTMCSAAAWSQRYPLYQLGNPQLRVFRTNFFIWLVRPGTAQPEDTVQFRIPMEMTRVDLRNYLERIYNVPVAAVRTRVQHGSNRKRDYRNVRMKKPDYKVAYVQLAHGQTFTFPDLFPEKQQGPDGSPGDEDLRDRLLEEQRRRQSRDPRRGGVPDWFGL